MSWSKASLILLAVAAGVTTHGERARACGGWGFDPTEGGFFDEGILEDDANLRLQPSLAGFGSAGCNGCDGKSLIADWHGFLKDTGITDADWNQVLFKATPSELSVMKERAAGKNAPAPKGYAQSSVWKVTKGADKLAQALAVVELAHRVEPFASFADYDQDGQARPPRPSAESNDVLSDARAALKAARDPFLAQRYAFQVLRILFYQRDWSGVVAFFDKTTATLQGPSSGLHYRARYYLAGALARSNHGARANLELARVHANAPELAAAAAQDFHPKEEADWRDAVAQAKDVHDKVALWRLVGVTQDGVAAMQEIVKLDPKSPLIALLMVRELARVEGSEKADFAKLEQIATAVIAKGGDRPWLMELVIGHMAARRGDIEGARTHLGRATAARPKDARVGNQARASLALALASTWRIDAQHEDELAHVLGEIAADYSRRGAVRYEIRTKLAPAYQAAGKLVDAELLSPGVLASGSGGSGGSGSGASRWEQTGFLKDMLARMGRTSTEFERFVLESSLTREGVEQDLALRYLLDGDFAAASKEFATTTAHSEALGTDPFVMHVVDCHDCDHERYAKAPWTHASVAAKLAELHATAKGTGEAAAEASLSLGVALYNLTWFGNARSMTSSSHQEPDPRLAESWFRHAYEQTKNRETKAKAAYYAAKAELGEKLRAAASSNDLPVAKTWFAQLKKLDDTKYYKEVLKECSAFRDYVAPKKK